MSPQGVPSSPQGRNIARQVELARARGRLEALLDCSKAAIDLSPDGFRTWLAAELKRAQL